MALRIHSATWVAPPQIALPPKLEAKLSRFADFEDGWAFGVGRAFGDVVLNRARFLLALACGQPALTAVDAFPGRNGQIVVSLYKGDDEYNFSVWPHYIELCKEINGQDVEADAPLSLKEAIAEIQALGADAWGSSYSSPLTITTRTSGASKAKPLSRLMTTTIIPVSRYLTMTAASLGAAAHAGTPMLSIGHQYQQGTEGISFGTSSQPLPSQGWITLSSPTPALPGTTAIAKFAG